MYQILEFTMSRENSAEYFETPAPDRYTQHSGFTIVRGGLAGWQAKRVAAYVEEHIGADIRAADLAAITRLSLSHFFRAFRKSFGETPHSYVRRRRMHRAQAIMLSSNQPLAQIALDCGMCDQAHFSRVFRKVVGINPWAWRRQYSLGPRALPGTEVSFETA
jgi:AraC family transcriptional regulator